MNHVNKLLTILLLGATALLQAGNPESTYHMQNVFFTPALRNEFSSFIDNVLRQIPSQQLFNFIDATLIKKGPYSDREIYNHLINNAAQITPSIQFYHQLGALNHQKKVLSEQICTLLESSTIGNVVEIGTPATYASSLMDHKTITGTVQVVHDKQRPTDMAQAFSLNPLKKFVMYDQFIPLNDYEPISEQAIASNSVDLVICVIGLHHIPQEKLDGFITSIRRILKPNGTFILRDHDVTNPDLNSIAHTAHSVFNVIMNQDTLETELAEYRNFQSLDYWIQRVTSHGFKVGPKRLLQKGDPTRNTMIRFTKVPQTIAEKEEAIVMNLHEKKDYKRDSMQTYLTSPEWFCVDISQEYGKFIEHTPFYEYPHFQNVQEYWKVFTNSWKQAAQEKGNFAVATSPYTAMNLFIGVMKSVEYGCKGLISIPMRWAYSGAESETLYMLVKDPYHTITSLDSRIKIIEEYPGTDTALIEVPRYKAFLDCMLKLAQTDVTLIEIAGNTSIQIRVKYHKNNGLHFPEDNQVETLYSWHLQTQPEYEFAAVKVPVKQLINVIRECTRTGTELLYIHDF